MFSDNDRISGIQLNRQIAVGLTGAFLLILTKEGALVGRSGLLGLLGGFAGVLLYLAVLVRASTCYRDPERLLGKAGATILRLFYLSYLVLTGSFLLAEAVEMVRTYLMPGSQGLTAAVLLLAVSLIGTGSDVQRRGRMGEISYPLLMLGFLLMLAVAAGAVNPDLVDSAPALSGNDVLEGAYAYYAACMILSVVPFLLNRVQGEHRFSHMARAIAAVTLITGSALLILLGTFGYEGMIQQKTPILKLMSRVMLPGGFLDRFDIIWIAFLLFSLLFGLGTVLFYGRTIGEFGTFTKGGYVLALLVLIGALVSWGGADIRSFYREALELFYTPALTAIPILMWICGKWRKIG